MLRFLSSGGDSWIASTHTKEEPVDTFDQGRCFSLAESLGSIEYTIELEAKTCQVVYSLSDLVVSSEVVSLFGPCVIQQWLS